VVVVTGGVGLGEPVATRLAVAVGVSVSVVAGATSKSTTRV